MVSVIVAITLTVTTIVPVAAAWLPQVRRACVKTYLVLWNRLFAPHGFYNGRRAKQTDPDAHLKCDEKWKNATARLTSTGECYLVIGNGFVGKGIVRCLLERGETNIRVFDIMPSTAWKGHPHVTFIRGNVTKLPDISKACEGVQIVYSTFAVIRFMDRLDFQVPLSYNVNVTGMEVVIEALRANNCERLIMTSTSNVTSDVTKHNLFDLEESVPYTTREKSPHHYGWTKALAEQVALKADGAKLANGRVLQVVAVRPCGAVVSGDDGLTFTRLLDIGLYTSLGNWSNDGFTALMDFTYVDNVLLGHLLAEQALRDGKAGVRGEAFNISNDDPVSPMDVAGLFQQHIDLLRSKRMRERLIVHWMYLPVVILSSITWFVETFTNLTKGKVKLPKEVELLTPALIMHMNLGFTFSSRKAKDRLGYTPVFNMDEAFQRSLHDFYRMRYGKDE